MDSPTIPNLKGILKSFVPFLGSGLLFLGLIRLYIYYQLFNVNVVEYIAAGEIITSFLDVVVIIALVLITLLCAAAFTLFLRDAFTKKKARNTENDEDTDTPDEPSIKTRYFILFSVVMATLKSVPEKSLYVFIFNYLAIAGAVVVIWAYKVLNRKDRPPGLLSFLFPYALLIIASIFWLASSSFYKAHRVIDKKKYYGTVIMLTDGTYMRSDSNRYFMGKTSEYVFVHNESEKATEIIPINLVKKIKLTVDAATPPQENMKLPLSPPNFP